MCAERKSRNSVPADQRRVLVAHASRTGATAGVAVWIGRELADRGALVDVAPVDQVDDLGRYDAVVFGSAIRYDRWLPEMLAFLRDHVTTLRRLPLAGFSTCMVLARGAAEAVQRAERYVRQVDEILLSPDGHAGPWFRRPPRTPPAPLAEPMDVACPVCGVGCGSRRSPRSQRGDHLGVGDLPGTPCGAAVGSFAAGGGI